MDEGSAASPCRPPAGPPDTVSCREARDGKRRSRSLGEDSQTAEGGVAGWPGARRRRWDAGGTSSWAVSGTLGAVVAVPSWNHVSPGACSSPRVVPTGYPASSEGSGAGNRDQADVVVVSDEEGEGDAFCVDSDDEVEILGSSQGGASREPTSESVETGEGVVRRLRNGQNCVGHDQSSSDMSIQSRAARAAAGIYPLQRNSGRPQRRYSTEAAQPPVAGASGRGARRPVEASHGDRADSTTFRRRPGRRQQGHVDDRGSETRHTSGLLHELKEADRRLARARATVQRLRQAEDELFRERRELEQRRDPRMQRSLSPGGRTSLARQSRVAEIAAWEQRLVSVRRQSAAARRQAAEASLRVRRLRRSVWAAEGGLRAPVVRRDWTSSANSGASTLPHDCGRRRARGDSADASRFQREAQVLEAFVDVPSTLPDHARQVLLGWAWLEAAGFSQSLPAVSSGSEDKLSEEVISRLPCVTYREQEVNSQVQARSAERSDVGRARTSTGTGNVGESTEAERHGSNGEDGRCAICMDAYKGGDALRYLPCLHVYHQTCIDIWLSQSGRCPICKESVLRLMERANSVASGLLDEAVEPEGYTVE